MNTNQEGEAVTACLECAEPCPTDNHVVDESGHHLGFYCSWCNAELVETEESLRAYGRLRGPVNTNQPNKGAAEMTTTCTTCGKDERNGYKRVIGGDLTEMCCDPCHGPHLTPMSGASARFHQFHGRRIATKYMRVAA